MRPTGAAADTAVAAGLGLCVLLTHDVPYLLRTPYWLDESWVAVSTRLPVRDAALASGPSPLGWTLLLRLVPHVAILGWDEQRQRLVPLLFAGFAVALSYLLLRSLAFGRGAAVLAGGLVMLVVPAMTVRDDLKQYTADTTVVVLLLLLVSRLEHNWTRGRLLALAAVVGLSPLLSSAGVFAGSAAFVAVGAVVLRGADRSRLRQTLVAGVAAVASAAGILLTTVLHHAGGGQLRAFWIDSYLSRSPAGAARQIWSRSELLVQFTGTTSLLLCTVLTVAGVGTVVRSRHPATALLVPVAVAEAAVAAVAHTYPFLDLRVSAWLLSCDALLMAVGVAGFLRWLSRRESHGPMLRVAAAVLALLCAGLYVQACRPHLRSHPIFAQDVRSQVSYLRAHQQPGDVVLVTLSATWAFAYYDDDPAVRAVASSDVATGFLVSYPNSSRVVAMSSRGTSAIEVAVRDAESLAAGGSGRVWVVRTQIAAAEQSTWAAFSSRCGVSVLAVGIDPLLLDDTRQRGCR